MFSSWGLYRRTQGLSWQENKIKYKKVENVKKKITECNKGQTLQ